MRYLIVYLFVFSSIILVFTSLIHIFQYINYIQYRREEIRLLLDICLVYNNPGSRIIKVYHISEIPLKTLSKYCNIDIKHIKIIGTEQVAHLALLNISSTINMTKIKIGD